MPTMTPRQQEILAGLTPEQQAQFQARFGGTPSHGANMTARQQEIYAGLTPEQQAQFNARFPVGGGQQGWDPNVPQPAGNGPFQGPPTPGTGQAAQQNGGINPQTGLPWGQHPGMGQAAQQNGGINPQYGLSGAEDALRGGLAAALSGLQQGRGDMMGQFNFGAKGLEQFIGSGFDAQQLQAAYSGALGPEAQAAAFAQYNDSPGQDFLRERGERAVTRNASALGGLGGGRVMQELQRQGQGLAQQDFANQYDRLGQLSNQGLTAAQGAGNLRGQLGTNLGNMGWNAANLAHQTGNSLAAYRNQAGRDIAGNVNANATGLSNLVNHQGIGMSGLLGSTGGNLATLLAGAGEGQSLSQQQLQMMLANLGVGTGSQVAGLPGLGGTQQAGGTMGNWGSLLSGIANAYTAYNS